MSRSFTPLALAMLCAAAADCRAQCGPGWLPLFTTTPGSPRAMVLWDSDGAGPLPVAHVIAGEITVAGGVTFNHIARWNGAGWAPVGGGVTRGPGTVDPVVSALAVLPDGSLVAAGTFIAAGGTPAAGIARWDGQAWTPLATSITRPPFSLQGGIRALLALPNGDLIAGGDFTSIDGVPARSIARWDGSGWHALGSGITAPEGGPVSAAVFALALAPDNAIIAAGQFTHLGDLAAGNIARWDGAAWHALGSGLSGPVLTLQWLPSGDLAAGGGFSGVPPLPHGVALWNGVTWSPTGPGITSPIFALALDAAGQLLAAGGSVFRWTGSQWVVEAPTDGQVRAMAVTEPSDLLIAGSFNTINGVSSNRVGRRVQSATPRIFSHPQPTSVPVGSTALFTAIPEAGFAERAYLTCQWQRNGQDVVPGYGGASPGGGIASPNPPSLTVTWPVTLQIIDARPSDAGEYTLTLTSACGETTSIPATLTITGVPCPADWNDDGDVSSADISAFLASWISSVQDGTPGGDFDGDGTVTSSDIAAFLGAWLEAVQSGC